MSENMRPELSKNNKYWLERHRYYELIRNEIDNPRLKGPFSLGLFFFPYAGN